MNCFFPFKEKPESRKAKSSEEVVIAKEHNLRVFSYSELKTATDNFNSSLKLGEGGFGSVYKATIRHPKGKEGVPTAVAIKRFTGERVISSTFFFPSFLFGSKFLDNFDLRVDCFSNFCLQ